MPMELPPNVYLAGHVCGKGIVVGRSRSGGFTVYEQKPDGSLSMLNSSPCIPRLRTNLARLGLEVPREVIEAEAREAGLI